jgi:hypothetical protein
MKNQVQLFILRHKRMIVGGIVLTGLLGLGMTMGGKPETCSTSIRAVTWNVAAVNNNPFEYWITHNDPGYNSLIDGVQEFINAPGDRDVPVSQLISDDMMKELFSDFAVQGWGEQLPDVEKRWHSDLKNRKIISEFLKDKELGKKRLTSMPDRMTNTIRTAEGNKALRPTVINCFEGDLGTTASWWKQWRSFMFNDKVRVPGKRGSGTTQQVPAQMLQPIRKSKYPDITAEEEKISIPLQTVALAIFDGILVHMLNTVAKDKWQPIRAEICSALNKNKVASHRRGARSHISAWPPHR